MKVLYCSWYENSQEDLENALNKIKIVFQFY